MDHTTAARKLAAQSLAEAALNERRALAFPVVAAFYRDKARECRVAASYRLRQAAKAAPLAAIASAMAGQADAAAKFVSAPSLRTEAAELATTNPVIAYGLAIAGLALVAKAMVEALF